MLVFVFWGGQALSVPALSKAGKRRGWVGELDTAHGARAAGSQ